MKLIFIDETGNHKGQPDFYGICAVMIDSAKYSPIAKNFRQTMLKSGWKEGVEFKGSHIFSSSKGDKTISVDDRIEMITKLFELNVSKKNARMKAVFTCNSEGDGKENHLYLVNHSLKKLLGNAENKGGKNLCVVYVDGNSKFTSETLRSNLIGTISDKGYTLIEDEIIQLKSASHQVGLWYADTLAYLCSWMCRSAGNETEAQLSLFEEHNLSSTDERKVHSTKNMLRILKDIKIVRDC